MSSENCNDYKKIRDWSLTSSILDILCYSSYCSWPTEMHLRLDSETRKICQFFIWYFHRALLDLSTNFVLRWSLDCANHFLHWICLLYRSLKEIKMPQSMLVVLMNAWTKVFFGSYLYRLVLLVSVVEWIPLNSSLMYFFRFHSQCSSTQRSCHN